MSLETNKSIRIQRVDKYQPFGKSLILQIVQEVESGLCRKQACITYGMAYFTLGEWMRKYGSETYHMTKRPFFSPKEKRSAVRAVCENRMTKAEACIAYKVQKGILNAWLLKFKREEEELAVITQPAIMNLTSCTKGAIQKDLSDALLKIRALETMIDIAEEQFKISIRKKSGAKQ